MRLHCPIGSLRASGTNLLLGLTAASCVATRPVCVARARVAARKLRWEAYISLPVRADLKREPTYCRLALRRRAGRARLPVRLCKQCNFDTPSLSARIHARQLRRSLRGSPPPSGRPCTRRATVSKMTAAHHRLARSKRVSAEAPRRAQRRGCSARAGRR